MPVREGRAPGGHVTHMHSRASRRSPCNAGSSAPDGAPHHVGRQRGAEREQLGKAQHSHARSGAALGPHAIKRLERRGLEHARQLCASGEDGGVERALPLLQVDERCGDGHPALGVQACVGPGAERGGIGGQARWAEKAATTRLVRNALVSTAAPPRAANAPARSPRTRRVQQPSTANTNSMVTCRPARLKGDCGGRVESAASGAAGSLLPPLASSSVAVCLGALPRCWGTHEHALCRWRALRAVWQGRGSGARVAAGEGAAWADLVVVGQAISTAEWLGEAQSRMQAAVLPASLASAPAEGQAPLCELPCAPALFPQPLNASSRSPAGAIARHRACGRLWHGGLVGGNQQLAGALAHRNGR